MDEVCLPHNKTLCNIATEKNKSAVVSFPDRLATSVYMSSTHS